MTIYKTKSLIETYRAKASAKDINELTGRTGRPDLTEFIISQLSKKIPVQTNSIVVDVGCGAGLFLIKTAENGLDSYKGRLIGILPTVEEVSRVRNHLLQGQYNKFLISIELGLAEKTNLPDDYCDILVCNGVLHGGGQSIENVKPALAEIYRITKPGGTIVIGEMPDSDEMTGKNFGDSITKWLYWVLKNQGFKSFWTRLKQTIPAFFSNEPFIVGPKNSFYMPPQNFIALLEQYGIHVVEHYRLKEIDGDGTEYESKTRWNYIGIKRSVGSATAHPHQ